MTATASRRCRAATRPRAADFFPIPYACRACCVASSRACGGQKRRGATASAIAPLYLYQTLTGLITSSELRSKRQQPEPRRQPKRQQPEPKRQQQRRWLPWLRSERLPEPFPSNRRERRQCRRQRRGGACACVTIPGLKWTAPGPQPAAKPTLAVDFPPQLIGNSPACKS